MTKLSDEIYNKKLKNMKTKIIILISFLTCFGNIQAQGLFVKAGGSFALGWPWTYSANETYNQIEMSTTGTQAHARNANFGMGISPIISAGYMFNSFIGAELGFGYQFGINRVNENTYLNTTSLKTYEANSSIKCSWMWLNPQLIIATNYTAFSPYGKVGLIMGFSPKMTILVENVDDSGIRKSEITGGMPWGFNLALGINKKIKNNISVFGEIEMTQMNYTPEQSEITEFKDSEGNDILSTLNLKTKTTEFSDCWSSDDISNDNPNKSARINVPLSCIKFNAGIRINF